MSLFSDIIRNTKALIDDIRMDEEEKKAQMLAQKRSAKRSMKRSIDSNKKKISEIEYQIETDKALGKKYILDGNRELAAVQAEKVLFKTPVLQKINKVVLNQEKIYFVLDATEDIKTFNQELVVFDKIEQVNSNPDLIGVQAEKAVDNIMQELESPLISDVSYFQEPLAENPLVTSMLDEWMGEETVKKITPESATNTSPEKSSIKENQEAKIRELKKRAENLSKED